MSEPILQARALVKTYPSGDRRIEVLRGVDFAVGAGESVSIRGESGCGKSTLLHLLAGLDTPDTGDLLWDGEPRVTPERRARFLGMVFQAYYLIPELDARQNVLMAARIAGRLDAAARARAEDLLRRVGLAERAHHLPAHLSGGERQRVALARALVNRPRIILADEPTGNLDEATGNAVMDLLLDLCAQEQVALVLVTHNKEHAARTARQATLHLGKLQIP
ncbi:MAG: ABC transporter ATP-binding protein [Opitutaceae bacterium]|nr:ABC transporter ATP-binding protein [Opitutaceae bacterium]